MSNLPIEAAERLARQYGLRQVVIWGWDGASQHVTTWGGPDLGDSLRAAEAGNAFKRLARWPEEICRSIPQHFIKVYEDYDGTLARSVESGGLDKGQCLACLYELRETVRSHDPELAELLIPAKTEAAELRTALSQLEREEERR